MPDSSLTMAIIMAAVGSSTSLSLRVPEEKTGRSGATGFGASMGFFGVALDAFASAFSLGEIFPRTKRKC